MAPDAPLTRLRSVGPIFRAQEAVGAGVSWRDLYRLRDGGAIIELSRGLYQLGEAAGVDNIDFISLSARAPLSMVCLHSALSHWDLSDEIPPQVHIAVPQGAHRPQELASVGTQSQWQAVQRSGLRASWAPRA